MSSKLLFFFLLLCTAGLVWFGLVWCLIRPLEPAFSSYFPSWSWCLYWAQAWWMAVFIVPPLLWLNPHTPLIGLKMARLGFGWRGHQQRLCLNHFNVSTLDRPIGSLIKTGPRQDSQQAHRKRFGMQQPLSVSLFFLFFCIFTEQWHCEGRHIAHWHGCWHDYRLNHSCYHGNL